MRAQDSLLLVAGFAASAPTMIREIGFAPDSPLEEDGIELSVPNAIREPKAPLSQARSRVEACYWAAITFSQTLGTALGDWMADSGGLGYEGGAFVFAAGLAMIVGLYIWTNASRVLLFWAAFILTRPLRATVGDFLDKPLNHGGLAPSRPIASAVIGAAILAGILLLPQRAGSHASSV